LGLLIFIFALDGWWFLATGHATEPWNGFVSLFVCCGLCGTWGLVAYVLKDSEFGSGRSYFYDSPATAILFAKRVRVIATCLAGLYFIWQLAKGI